MKPKQSIENMDSRSSIPNKLPGYKNLKLHSRLYYVNFIKIIFAICAFSVLNCMLK